MRTVKVGTRGSKLAASQTRTVTDALSKMFPEVEFELVVIRSTGDKITDKPLSEIGGSGLFTSELENALLDGTIDFAVHSMKDLPAVIHEGLVLATPPKRADGRDALILKDGFSSLSDLPAGAVIGTGSPRRILQLNALRGDLLTVPIRGNVDSRIARVGQEVDGVVLAAAGLSRLGLTGRVTRYFDTFEMLPAPCQGILALEVREDNDGILDILSAVRDEETETAMRAERAFLKATGAGCHAPVGAFCKVTGSKITLDGMYGDENGFLRDSIDGAAEDAETLGKKLAETLCRKLEEREI